MTQTPRLITQNRRYPMLKIQFTVHTKPDAGQTSPSPALYRSVERQWPTVPRQGDVVSLGGGDQLLAEVRSVQFLDGKIVLVFLLDPEDREFLNDLGFEPTGRR